MQERARSTLEVRIITNMINGGVTLTLLDFIENCYYVSMKVGRADRTIHYLKGSFF